MAPFPEHHIPYDFSSFPSIPLSSAIVSAYRPPENGNFRWSSIYLPTPSINPQPPPINFKSPPSLFSTTTVNNPTFFLIFTSKRKPKNRSQVWEAERVIFSKISLVPCFTLWILIILSFKSGFLKSGFRLYKRCFASFEKKIGGNNHPKIIKKGSKDSKYPSSREKIGTIHFKNNSSRTFHPFFIFWLRIQVQSSSLKVGILDVKALFAARQKVLFFVKFLHFVFYLNIICWDVVVKMCDYVTNIFY